MAVKLSVNYFRRSFEINLKILTLALEMLPQKEGHMNGTHSNKSMIWLKCQPKVSFILIKCAGIHALGLTPNILGDGQLWNFMGIFSKNREEWAMMDLACIISSVTIVPFYDSLGMDALAMVINQTELTTMCIERTNLELLLKLKETQCASLQNLILFGEATSDEVENAKLIGLSIYTFSEVIKAGDAN